MSLTLALTLLGIMVVLRLIGASLLVWVAFWLGGLWTFFQYGFTVPVPQTAINIYMSITALALLAYSASSPERIQSTFVPIVRLLVEPKYTIPLVLLAIALPAAAAYNVYREATVPIEPPYFARTIHPAPPPEINVGGVAVDLINGDHPYRALEETDPAAFGEHVANGKRVYYENCFYCHGDALAADGMFAHGLDPIPTNFRDANVLPNFRETFFFWRISKGGPGMPDEGGPGDSAMPRWEQFLTPDEMYDVILFLYDFAGYRPRAKEEHGHE